MPTSESHQPSLTVMMGEKIVFKSHKKWLYPLFDLEAFLADHPSIDIHQSFVKDKVIGKAAAMLISRLGPRQVHGVIMSELAVDVFQRFNILFQNEQLISRIDCQTERLLLDINDLEIAYQMLCDRASQ